MVWVKTLPGYLCNSFKLASFSSKYTYNIPEYRLQFLALTLLCMPFKAFPLLYEFVFCMIMVSSLTNTSHIIVYNSRFNITSDNDRSLKMSPYPQQFEYIFYTLHSNWELSLMWYHSVNIFCCFS